MKRMICCLLLLALLAVPCAMASDYTALSNSDILRRGSHGDNVRRLQQVLVEKGYLSGKVDGSYGSMTESAVRAFQIKNGITASGVATMFTQAKLFGYDALYAWNNSNLYNGNSGAYDIVNVESCGEENDIAVWFDFVNRDTSPVEAICIYYWLADSRNNLVTQSHAEYWIQWYYNMNVPYGSQASVSYSVPVANSAWRKIDTVRCIVGEIAYTDGTVVVTMNTSRQPYENRNYILSYNN